MKPKFTLDDSHDDFGFSAVSEIELKQYENQLITTVKQKDTELEAVSKTYEQKLESLYKLIMPLLMNLQKNPEKEYILWPNRADKVKEFIARVEKIVQ